MIALFAIGMAPVLLWAQRSREALFCAGFVSLAIGIAMVRIDDFMVQISGIFLMTAGGIACADPIGTWLHRKIEHEHIFSEQRRHEAASRQTADQAYLEWVEQMFGEMTEITLAKLPHESQMRTRIAWFHHDIAAREAKNAPKRRRRLVMRLRSHDPEKPLTRTDKIWLTVVIMAYATFALALVAGLIFLTIMRVRGWLMT